MQFFNVFQRFQRTETRWDARWDAVKDTSGLMKGAADSLQAGVLLKTRVVTCRPDVVPCRASTVQKPCRAFLKRTNWKKNFLDIRTDLCWEQRSGGVLVALLSFVSTWPKWRSWNVQGLENQHTERFLEQVAPGTLRYPVRDGPRRPETARDVANLRSSKSLKSSRPRFLFSIAIPSHSNGNEQNAKNNAIK